MRCLLCVDVSGSDGRAGLERYVDIPFMPTQGLRLVGVVEPLSNLYEVVVKSVNYNVITGEAEIILEEDNSTDTTLDEMLKDWGEEWSRV
jgi:hypothetical protein